MKIRVTARFYLLLLLVALIVVLIAGGFSSGDGSVTVIMSGTASDVRKVDALIIRDETVISEAQVSRVDFIADEAELVRAGDPVVYVYSLEYSSKLINELNNTRKNIQAYHKLVLGNELDSQLEVLNLEVRQKALELKELVNGNTHGNLKKLNEQLLEAMEARRSYMSQNKRSDSKLIKYYDEENQRLNAVSSWRTTKTAPETGVVSFYLDGYESVLTPENAQTLTAADVRTVIAGGSLDSSSKSGSQTDVYRIMNQCHWYVLLVSDDESWTPVLDQEISFVMEGYDNLLYDGNVIRVQKMGTTTLAQVEVTEDALGPLMYVRSGKATLGTDLNGLSVTAKAIDTVNGQTGVWMYDVPGGTFVPVEVLYKSSGTVLFRSLVEGVLSPGTQVLIK